MQARFHDAPAPCYQATLEYWAIQDVMRCTKLRSLGPLESMCTKSSRQCGELNPKPKVCATSLRAHLLHPHVTVWKLEPTNPREHQGGARSFVQYADSVLRRFGIMTLLLAMRMELPSNSSLRLTEKRRASRACAHAASGTATSRVASSVVIKGVA